MWSYMDDSKVAMMEFMDVSISAVLSACQWEHTAYILRCSCIRGVKG
jgi:hypothetical protein